jgi:hypothetical protein
MAAMKGLGGAFAHPYHWSPFILYGHWEMRCDMAADPRETSIVALDDKNAVKVASALVE